MLTSSGGISQDAFALNPIPSVFVTGKPSVAKEWNSKSLKDDPVIKSNKRGFVSFATSGKDSRTTQVCLR